jgi:ankyrin repeat protein
MSKVATVIVAILAALIGFGYYLDPNGEVIQELTGTGTGKIQIDTTAKMDDEYEYDHEAEKDNHDVPVDVPVPVTSEPDPEPEPEPATEPEPEPAPEALNYQHSDILQAIRQKDTAKIHQILRHQPNLAQSTDQNGWTILHELARAPSGHDETIHYLVQDATININIKSHVDLNARNGKDKNHDTVLDVAIQFQGIEHEVVQYLQSHGAKTAQEMDAMEASRYEQILNEAFEAGDHKTLKTVLEAQPHLQLGQKRDGNGWTLLHEAVRFGDLDMIRVLMEVGNSDVNARNGKDHNGDSVLDVAGIFIKDENHQVANYLISKGAKSAKDLDAVPVVDAVVDTVVDAVDAVEDYKLEDLRVALIRKEHDLCIHILNAQPDLVNSRDQNGWTILHEAVRLGNFEMVQFLVEKGDASVYVRNGKQGDQDDALDIAHEFLNQHHDVVRYLEHLDLGAEKEKSNAENENVNVNVNERAQLIKALSDEDMPKCTAILKQRPEFAQQTDDNGWTILHEAVRFGNLPMTELLVEDFNVDVNLRTHGNGRVGEGGSPLYYAWNSFGSDQHPLVKYLVDSGAVYIEPVVTAVQEDEL